MAVVVFYAISGYVMAGLLAKHYAEPSRTLRFYGDRILRIYPQYVFYATAAAVWLFTIGHPTAFLNLPARPEDGFNNLLIVPLNFFMFNGSDRFTLVPPAWSLGAELLFYLLAPLLWRSARLALVLGAGSLGVQAMAWHGLLQTDWWGYRLLPGVLWVFLLGMAMQRAQSSHPLVLCRAVMAWPFMVALVAIYLAWRGLLAQPYHREVLLGLAWGLPLIHLLSRWAPASHLWQWLEPRLGNWSYGIFLNHFLLMWVLDLPHPQSGWQWVLLLGSSVVLSALTQQWLEQPVLHWRRQWRQQGDSSKITT